MTFYYVVLCAVLAIGLVLGVMIGSDHCQSVYENALTGERQLLEMVVNTSRFYWDNQPIDRPITVFYPGDNLDTSVYHYQYNAENFAIIATARDSSLVPKGMEKIAYFIKTGLRVKYKYDWLK